MKYFRLVLCLGLLHASLLVSENNMPQADKLNLTRLVWSLPSVSHKAIRIALVDRNIVVCTHA